MEDIDKLIKETLSEEEARFYDDLGEQGIYGMLIGVFKGKNKWILVIMNLVSLAFFAFGVYSVVQFFSTDVTNELIMWAGSTFISLMFVSMIKLFMWLQMDKNVLMRELKRLELQVSSLSGKMSD